LQLFFNVKLIEGDLSMVETAEIPLRLLAIFAVKEYIRGTSDKRSSLLKPIDIIIKKLDRCTHPDKPEEIQLLRAAAKTDVWLYIERTAKEEYKPGRTKEGKVYEYVNLFFDGVLGQMHNNQVNKLLTRERDLRAAYLFWMREEIGRRFDKPKDE
jgi:hypothetical protein